MRRRKARRKWDESVERIDTHLRFDTCDSTSHRYESQKSSCKTRAVVLFICWHFHEQNNVLTHHQLRCGRIAADLRQEQPSFWQRIKSLAVGYWLKQSAARVCSARLLLDSIMPSLLRVVKSVFIFYRSYSDALLFVFPYFYFQLIQVAFFFFIAVNLVGASIPEYKDKSPYSFSYDVV